MICLTLALGSTACGRRGDPIPRPRAQPAACTARWLDLRTLEIGLPVKDITGEDLVGVEKVRVYFLPVGVAEPTPGEVLGRGEVILEKRRPDLPAPGRTLRLDLREIKRQAGWLVVVTVRVGNVTGAPSPVLPWLDPLI